MTKELQEWLDKNYPGWTILDSLDAAAGFECPHGYGVEVDGKSFDGCVSPLVMEGM